MNQNECNNLGESLLLLNLLKLTKISQIKKGKNKTEHVQMGRNETVCNYFLVDFNWVLLTKVL